MVRCHYPGCAWQAIAPSTAAAREQYLQHVVDEHAREVDVDIPEGMVQVKVGDDEWRTVTPEEARRLHDRDDF